MILNRLTFQNSIKQLLGLFLILSLGLLLTSNSAQPGIWNAGGTGSFTLLYPEDSTAYKKIQMQSESIYMQLYKGYAVVKGNYHFYNTTDSLITIKVGYPINAVFPTTNFQNDLNEVVFDDLYKIKAAFNGQNVPIFEMPSEKNENWYVWELSFPAKQLVTFTVYFMVNTNNAKILKGYNSDYKNGFIYLIETGSLWKSPIENGDFYVQLMDNISIEDIKGSAPTKLFYNEANNVLFFNLKNYGIKPDNNLVITYLEQFQDFNFSEKTELSESLFNKIDQFSASDKNYTLKRILLKNPYEVSGSGNFIINFIYFFIIYGIPISLGLILCFIIYKVFFKHKKRDAK